MGLKNEPALRFFLKLEARLHEPLPQAYQESADRMRTVFFRKPKIPGQLRLVQHFPMACLSLKKE
jgi:hypothetical protein